MRRFIVGALASVAAASFTASAGPLQIEDIEKYASVSGVTMSEEGDFLAGIVHAPGSDGMNTSVATWDISGDIDTSKPLVPMALTQGNDRLRFNRASAFMDGKVIVSGIQLFTGSTVGCLEGKSTGSERTFVNQRYMASKMLDDLAPVYEKASGRRVDNDIIKQCLRLQAGMTRVASTLPLEDDWIMIQRGGIDGGKLFRRNLKTDKEIFFERDGERNGWGVALRDPRTYKTLAQSKLDPNNGDYRVIHRIKHPDTGKWVTADAMEVNLSDRYTMVLDGIDDATGKYIVITDKFSDKAVAYFYDIRTDKFDAEPILAHPKYSVLNVITSTRKKDFNKIVGFSYAADVSRTYYIEPERASVQDALFAAFPDRVVSIRDFTDDMSKVLFSVQDSAHPPVHYLLLDKSRVALVGAERPWVDSDSLRKTTMVEYTARDGLVIPGFLTLPKGWKQGDKPLPVIIHPHGGPWGRDAAGWDFSGWTQFFASRGYAVLQPQFRGTTGWGRKLWLAGDMEWGQKMQDDKDDGAQWLVDQGIGDPTQMAMFGYSYGGFAAMAATVRPNSPYQCAIAGAGVSNLERIQGNWGENRVQRLYQGRTVAGMDPLENMEKANIPILVYHGDRDVRVPLHHGTEFYKGVKRYQPESELLVLKDMGHQGNKWKPEHHRKSLSAMENFLTGPCGMTPTPVDG